jgi:hypothetical protein
MLRGLPFYEKFQLIMDFYRYPIVISQLSYACNEAESRKQQ